MYKRTLITQVYQNHSQHYNNYIFLLLHHGFKTPIFLSKVTSLLVIFGTSSTAGSAGKKHKPNKRKPDIICCGPQNNLCIRIVFDVRASFSSRLESCFDLDSMTCDQKLDRSVQHLW